MKPVLKTATYQYWACGVPEHRHKTEETAKRCLEKPIPISAIEREKYARKRNEAAFALRANGIQYTEIARILGTHPNYVQVCCYMHSRRLEREREPKVKYGI